VTVVLRIKRLSGATEVHELPAVGDVVVVPGGLLSSEDVFGYDVEVAGLDRSDVEAEVAAARGCEAEGAQVVTD
jgi:ribosomal protein L18E